VHVRAIEAHRDDEAAIGRLPVPSARLGSVSLDNIARFARARCAGHQISRVNRQRQVTLTANMLPGTRRARRRTHRERGPARLQPRPPATAPTSPAARAS
jgi:multidrug efflux pump subunit AcrB